MFFQNIKYWQLNDESRGVENLNDPIDNIFPKQHSLTETNTKFETVKENGHHLDGARVNGNRIHEDPNGHTSFNEDEDSNDEPAAVDVGNENNGKETGCEAGTTHGETIEDDPATTVPYYSRTLVAPEYLNFQLPGDTFQRDGRDTEDNNDIDADVEDRSRVMDNTENNQVQQQNALCQFDEICHEQEDITLAEDGSDENANHNRDGKNGKGDERAEDEDQKDKLEEQKELIIGSPQLAQGDEEHDEEIEDDGRDQQTKGDDGEDESDETGAEEEEEKGDDDVDKEHGGVQENEDEDGDDEDKEEVYEVDRDDEGRANRGRNCDDRADEKQKCEVVAVENNEEEEVGENNEEEGANEGEEENDGVEKNNEEVEEDEDNEKEVAKEQEKEDHVEEDSYEERAHKEDFIEQNKEGEIHENNGVAEDEEFDEEQDDLTLATQNESFTQSFKGDVEDDNQDEEIDQEDMAIRTKLTLEHWDSLKVNVASPTRDITEVGSAESLNELEADQTKEDEEEEDEEEKEKEEEEEEEKEEEEEDDEAPAAQQESLKTNVDQHGEATVTVGMS